MLETGDFVQLCDRYKVTGAIGRVAMVSQTQAYVFGLHGHEGIYYKTDLCRVTLTFAGVVRHASG